MNPRPIVLLLALGAAACNMGPYAAPVDAVLSFVPDAYELTENDDILVSGRAAEGDKPRGVLLSGRAMVADEDPPTAYDGKTLPLANIEVEFVTYPSTVCLIPETAMLEAAFPDAPDDITSMDDVYAACDLDGNNQIDADAPEWCAWYWNAEENTWYQIYGSYLGYTDDTSDEPYCPNDMWATTDSFGIVNFYFFIDQMPYTVESGETTFGTAEVNAFITNDSAKLMVTMTN